VLHVSIAVDDYYPRGNGESVHSRSDTRGRTEQVVARDSSLPRRWVRRRDNPHPESNGVRRNPICAEGDVRTAVSGYLDKSARYRPQPADRDGVGADGYFDSEGQRAVARSNARVGIASVVPEAGTYSLEAVAAAAPAAAVIGQLHPMGSEQNFLNIIHRYEDAGYRALCITCDCPTPGWRERNLTNRFNIDNAAVGGNYPSGAEIDMERALGQLYPQEEPVWSWARLAELMSRTRLPWIAKGILTVEDATAAVQAGASAIAVSNHGGRQLDGVPSPIEVLPSIAMAVKGQAQIVLDSGIRRGSDVVKAVALGADVVMIGRLVAYGLSAAGERGVDQVLALLKGEIQTTLTLLGRGGIRDLDGSAVAWSAR